MFWNKPKQAPATYVPQPKYRVIENGLGEFVVEEWQSIGRGAAYLNVKRFADANSALAFKASLIQKDDDDRNRYKVVRVIE